MVKERIRSLHDDLPPNQKALSEFILDHVEEIPFWSIQTLSKAAKTSTASIVRFSQRLGYSGFPAMRDDIANLMRSDLDRDYVSRIETLEGDVLSVVANQDVKDINETLKQLNRADFNLAVDAILESPRVHTAGMGISNLMSEILAYQLNQVGINAKAVRTGYTTFLEELAFFNSDETLIVFSYPPYSEDTVTLAQRSQEKGLKVIAISNRQATPVSFHADVTLPVLSENILYTNAFAAMSVIINALATECAHREPGKVEAMLSHFQKFNGIPNDTSQQ